MGNKVAQEEIGTISLDVNRYQYFGIPCNGKINIHIERNYPASLYLITFIARYNYKLKKNYLGEFSISRGTILNETLDFFNNEENVIAPGEYSFPFTYTFVQNKWPSFWQNFWHDDLILIRYYIEAKIISLDASIKNLCCKKILVLRNQYKISNESKHFEDSGIVRSLFTKGRTGLKAELMNPYAEVGSYANLKVYVDNYESLNDVIGIKVHLFCKHLLNIDGPFNTRKMLLKKSSHIFDEIIKKGTCMQDWTEIHFMLDLKNCNNPFEEFLMPPFESQFCKIVYYLKLFCKYKSLIFGKKKGPKILIPIHIQAPRENA